MSDGVPDPPQPRPRKLVSRARQRWSVMVLAGAAESLSSAKQEKLQVTTTTEGLSSQFSTEHVQRVCVLMSIYFLLFMS